MIRTAILGASGYVGAELLRLCAGHPELRPARLFGDSQAGAALAEVHPHLAPAYPDLAVERFVSEALDRIDLVFAALPHGHSQAIAPEVLDRGIPFVDLGADFRLDGIGFKTWRDFGIFDRVEQHIKRGFHEYGAGATTQRGFDGIVHDLWRPIAQEFDDYVAAPKDNFYRSLHTAVLDTTGKTLEIQIRTWEMHEHAEYGIAAQSPEVELDAEIGQQRDALVCKHHFADCQSEPPPNRSHVLFRVQNSASWE